MYAHRVWPERASVWLRVTFAAILKQLLAGYRSNYAEDPVRRPFWQLRTHQAAPRAESPGQVQGPFGSSGPLKLEIELSKYSQVSVRSIRSVRDGSQWHSLGIV